jgi:hypothetical protein
VSSETATPTELLREALLIIETADNRAMATDGPVSRTPDEMSDAEWRRLYKCLTTAHAALSAMNGGGRD